MADAPGSHGVQRDVVGRCARAMAVPRGVVLNGLEARCAAWESGRMFFAAAARAGACTLEYREIGSCDDVPPDGYDFYVFNHHHETMPWLDARWLRELPGRKLSVVSAVGPESTVPSGAWDFAAYLVLDPTYRVEDPRVFAMPRPLDVVPGLPSPTERDVPWIGSFGAPGPGKGFEVVVHAANKEFERAVVRLLIPAGTADDPDGARARTVGETCRRLAKPGIEVRVEHGYLNRTELVRWCAENTLNVLFQHGDRPGLSAAADQAIAAGRPLAVSPGAMFRHVHRHLDPYPRTSLRTAIGTTLPAVLRMREEWSAERVAERFTEVIGRVLPPSALPRVLLVTHPERHCGVHEYGDALFRALQGSERYAVGRIEPRDGNEFLRLAHRLRPAAIIYDWHPSALPWLDAVTIRRIDAAHIALHHELRPEDVDHQGPQLFDHHVFGDPTLGEGGASWSATGRIVPAFTDHFPPPPIPAIGSLGFALPGRGLESLAARVNDEFDVAVLRFLMPVARMVDPDGVMAGQCVAAIRAAITKPGIRLEISHVIPTTTEAVEFLARNSLNAFLCEVAPARAYGLSIWLDLALAAGRPIAVTRRLMQRHQSEVVPSICIEDRTLREILATGSAHLEPLRRGWTPAMALADWERILGRVLAAPRRANNTEPLMVGGLNRMLDDRARAEFAPHIDRLHALAPVTIQRKIPRANVQQAFMLATVERLVARTGTRRILCVGSFEDTACEALQATGLPIEAIDPVLDCDLATFCARPTTVMGSYDMVFSTSVLEHVEDDERFLLQIDALLAPGGHAVLTCDFQEHWRPGAKKPEGNHRFYRREDLERRLLRAMPGCVLADVPSWADHPHDFWMAGFRYTFASLVVRKRGGAPEPWEEVAARQYLDALPAGPKVLIEARGAEGEEPWGPAALHCLVGALAPLQPVLLYASRLPCGTPPTLRELWPGTVCCGEPEFVLRELLLAADVFIGVGGPLTRYAQGLGAAPASRILVSPGDLPHLRGALARSAARLATSAGIRSRRPTTATAGGPTALRGW